MRRWSCLAAALALAVATPAQAQETQTGPAADPSGPAAPAATDTGGSGAAPAPPAGEGDKAAPKKPTVTPGYSWTDKPQKAARRHHRDPKLKFDPNAPIATYPGFRMLPDGSSQLWVQVSRKVPITAGSAGSLPTYVLVGAQVTIHNNTRPLVTEYFDTPLARARLKPDAAGAQLVLELRESVQPKYRTVDGPGGTMLLYVDLPKSKRSYAATADDFAPKSGPIRSGKVLPGPRRSRIRRSSRGPNP